MYIKIYDAKVHAAVKARMATRRRAEAAQLQNMMEAKIAAGRGYLTEDAEENMKKNTHGLKLFGGKPVPKRKATNKSECLDEMWDKINELLDEAEELEKD